MRAADRELPAVVAELARALAAGYEPNLTATEWDLLAAYIRKQGKPDRRGIHKSMTRYLQGVNRRDLQGRMKWLKRKLRNDPAKRELKRTMRRNGDHYILNQRVAMVMHERLMKAGWQNAPSVAVLENILSRSTAKDDPREPWD